ncbi:hypothetical protein [Lacinutrix undariae]
MSTKKKTTETPIYNANITEKERNAIGEKGLRADSKDDRLLLDRKEPIDFQGKDLDVPGRTESKWQPEKSITDEENTIYSLGGEHHQDLEAPERANSNKK